MLVVLIFTLALTAIGIISAKLAVQGEAMARNQLDSQVARQAAEAALRDAERDLMLATGVKRSNAPCARDAERPVRDKESLFDAACTHGQCAYNDSVRTTANFASASATTPGEAWWPTSKGGLWNNSVASKPSSGFFIIVVSLVVVDAVVKGAYRQLSSASVYGGGSA